MNHKHDVVPYLNDAHDSAVMLHSYLKEQTADNFEYVGPESNVEFCKDVAEVMFSTIIMKNT